MSIVIFENYRRSLKMPEAEELFDLIFYRPAAYLLVLPLSKTPITPNQITMLSLIAGCIAAYYLSLASPAALLLAAIWYAAANILDCADGQLARIKKNGTPLGRIIDGVADYFSSVAIFLCIGFGLEKMGNPQWLLVIAAGVTSAIHAITFDGAQAKFISIVRGEEEFSSKELERYTEVISELRKTGSSHGRIFVLSLYISYLRLQHRLRKGTTMSVSPAQFRVENKSMIRWWTLLGPTTNRTILILSALMGNVEMFLWIVLVPGNLWLLVCLVGQRSVDKKLAGSLIASEKHSFLIQ